MSRRGREAFDQYVAKHLNHPDLAMLPMSSHVHNLTLLAREAAIPISEITDEVGPLPEALAHCKDTTEAGSGSN